MKEKIMGACNKVKMNYLAASTMIMCTAVGVEPVFAADMDSLMTQLVSIVCTLFRYIGILLLVWAVGQLVLAFKNEDADSKSRAMMLMVASVVLIGLKSIVNQLGLLNNNVTDCCISW